MKKPIAIILGAIFGIWLICMMAGFSLVWGPPGILYLFFISLPWVNSRIASLYFSKNGFGSWLSSRPQIEKALETPNLNGIVAASSTGLLLLWIFLKGYPALSLAEAFNSQTLHGFFVGDSGGAKFARFFFTAVPWIFIIYGLILAARFFVVRRIQKIAMQLSGSDAETAILHRLDYKITECFRSLGSQLTPSYADNFQLWVSGNVREVIRNSSRYKAEFHNQKSKAEKKLEELEPCVAKFNKTKLAYQNGLARLRKTTSVALLAALEDAGRVLLSDAFIQLVDEGRWDDVKSFLSEVLSELERIEIMKDEWANAAGEPSASSKTMTVERAIRILALPKTFSPEDVGRRRKELARIYHPDRAASDTDLLARNQEAMKEINEACDFLSGASVT